MTRPAAARALLERADRITFDIARQVYVADGTPLDQELVGDLIESGALVRVPWTVRHYAAEATP